MVNGPDDVYVERKGRIVKVDDRLFEGEEAVLHVIERISLETLGSPRSGADRTLKVWEGAVWPSRFLIGRSEGSEALSAAR